MKCLYEAETWALRKLGVKYMYWEIIEDSRQRSNHKCGWRKKKRKKVNITTSTRLTENKVIIKMDGEN